MTVCVFDSRCLVGKLVGYSCHKGPIKNFNFQFLCYRWSFWNAAKHFSNIRSTSTSDERSRPTATKRPSNRYIRDRENVRTTKLKFRPFLSRNNQGTITCFIQENKTAIYVEVIKEEELTLLKKTKRNFDDCYREIINEQ